MRIFCADEEEEDLSDLAEEGSASDEEEDTDEDEETVEDESGNPVPVKPE